MSLLNSINIELQLLHGVFFRLWLQILVVLHLALLFDFFDTDDLFDLLLEYRSLTLLLLGSLSIDSLDHPLLHFIQFLPLCLIGIPVLPIILLNGCQIGLCIPLPVDLDTLLSGLPLLGIHILTVHIIENSLYIILEAFAPKIPEYILLLNLLIQIIPKFMGLEAHLLKLHHSRMHPLPLEPPLPQPLIPHGHLIPVPLLGRLVAAGLAVEHRELRHEGHQNLAHVVDVRAVHQVVQLELGPHVLC